MHMCFTEEVVCKAQKCDHPSPCLPDLNSRWKHLKSSVFCESLLHLWDFATTSLLSTIAPSSGIQSSPLPLQPMTNLGCKPSGTRTVVMFLVQGLEHWSNRIVCNLHQLPTLLDKVSSCYLDICRSFCSTARVCYQNRPSISSVTAGGYFNTTTIMTNIQSNLLSE